MCEVTASASLKKTPSLFISVVIPAGTIPQVMFWVIIPVVLLLCSLGFSYLIPSPFTPYLSFLTALGLGLSIKWKKRGLSMFYICLASLLYGFYSSLGSAALWQCGMACSLGLSMLIAYYSFEEISSLLQAVQEENAEQVRLLTQAAEEHQAEESNWIEEQKALEAELKKWKDQAEQRRIEKQADERQLALVQTEIEMLTQQKEKLLQESFESRSLAAQAAGEMKFIQKEMQSITASMQTWQDEKQEISHARALLEAQVKEKNQRLAVVDHQVSTLSTSLENVTLEKQALSQKSQEEIDQLSNVLKCLQEQKEALAEEKARLEKQLFEQKEQYHAIQQQFERIQTSYQVVLAEQETNSSQINSEAYSDLQREKNRIEGLYLQLRKQFEEKTAILAQTRKELFEFQGKALAYERELELNATLDLDMRQQYVNLLQNDVSILGRENEQLETEINALEELISLLLSQ